MKNRNYLWEKRRIRVAEIIEMGSGDDWISRGYNIFSTVVLLVNLLVTVLYTFNKMEARYGELLLVIEAVTVACFAADYCLRV